ncbi:MAG: polysaccharide deacetylase family protein [Sphingobacteriaceae bacterium]
MYVVKSPFWLKWLYPGLTWNESRKEKYIYLTFDDGPIPIVTPFVLKTLKKFNAKATFFCIGDNIRKHSEIFSEVLAEGHAVGNHTFHHVNGWKTKDKAYLEDFKKCEDLVESNLFRPPYGRIKRSQIKKLIELWVEGQNLRTPNSQLKIIMWDVLTYDFDGDLKPEDCLKHTLKHTENGSIVVFHDSLKAQERLEYTLPRALAYWTKKGYQFKTW